MANYRDSYWRYVTGGLARLVEMIAEHANDVEPGADELARLIESTRRLREVADKFQPPAPPAEG